MVDKSQFTPRSVLRTNLKACMKKAGEPGKPESQSALHRRSKVGQATIGRILSTKGEDSGIETIAKLAKAYGLEPWQLMVPGMDPGNPPVLRAASKEEQALYQRLREAALEFAKREGSP